MVILHVGSQKHSMWLQEFMRKALRCSVHKFESIAVCEMLAVWRDGVGGVELK